MDKSDCFFLPMICLVPLTSRALSPWSHYMLTWPPSVQKAVTLIKPYAKFGVHLLLTP